MNQATIYYMDSREPTELTGLYSNGQMLPHVAKWQAEIEREVQSRYKCEPAKNMTGSNANMRKKRVER